MDAIGELRSDHRVIEARLRELRDTSAKASRRRRKLFKAAAEDVARHLDLEEQLVFPIAEQEGDAKAVVLKAVEQHAVVRHLLTELSSTGPQEEVFAPRVEVLANLLHAHFIEEQRTVYPLLRTALTRRQLRALAERIRQGREAIADPQDYLRTT